MNNFTQIPLPSQSSSHNAPLLDQQPWPELDLFDITALSSPPSWVSGSEQPQSLDPAQVLPTLQSPQTPTSTTDFVCLPDPVDLVHYNPHPIEQSIPSQSAQILHFLSRTEPLHFPQHSKSAASVVPLNPVPDGHAIVDCALDFQSPDSPVLSHTRLAHQVHPCSAPAVQSTFGGTVPFLSQPVVEQTALPHSNSNYYSHLMSLANTATYSSSVVDSSESRQSSPSSTAFLHSSALPIRKQITTLTARTTTPIVTGRVQKQTRRYSAPKSSRYCHLCARHQRCVEMVPCGNVELGLCQKSVCKKCIAVYKLEVDGPSWACPHCQNNCPQRAKCFAYDRQTARRREKTLKAKLNPVPVRANHIGTAFKQ